MSDIAPPLRAILRYVRASLTTEPIDIAGVCRTSQAASLAIVQGPDAGRRFVMFPKAHLVGTSREAHIELSDATVSRRHAVVTVGPTQVEVKDLSSRNGTWVQEQRIAHAWVAPGQLLRFGRSVLRLEGPPTLTAPGFSGHSPALQALNQALIAATQSTKPVVIRGETGVGRGRVARIIHEQSAQGSFQRKRADRIEVSDLHHAKPGTLYIEDLEHLSPAVARALPLKAPQLRLVLSVTERRAIAFEARTLLERLVAEEAHIVRVPALRERLEDLPFLAAKFCEELGHSPLALTVDELRQLSCRTWPGNLREFKAELRSRLHERTPSTPGIAADRPYKEAKAQLLNSFERSYAQDLLQRHQGNISQAARAAGIDRVYLHRLIKKHQLRVRG